MDPDSLEITKEIAGASAREIIAQIAESFRSHSEPKKVVRMAKAESEALLVKLKSLGGFTEKEAQALLRPVLIRNIHDSNYSEIIDKAVPLINSDVSFENINDDWFLLHYEKASMYSNKDMQILWAKILAGELNRKGSFSRRTLNLVEQLDETDAKLFTQLGTCFFKCEGFTYLIIFNPNEDFKKITGLSWVEIVRLESLGLLSIVPQGKVNSRMVTMISENSQIECSYFAHNGVLKEITENEPSEEYTFPLGLVSLTKEGEELATICEPEPNEQLFEYVLKMWKRLDYDFIEKQ